MVSGCLVSLGGIAAGLVALLGLGSPLVVVPAPLLPPGIFPAWCLGSTATAVAAVKAALAVAMVVAVVGAGAVRGCKAAAVAVSGGSSHSDLCGSFGWKLAAIQGPDGISGCCELTRIVSSVVG